MPPMRAPLDNPRRSRSFGTLTARRDSAGLENGRRLGGMPIRTVKAAAPARAGAVGRTLGGVFRRLLRK